MLIIKIQNDGTGTEKIGNYRYQVLINQTVIESGEVKEHVRSKGWQNLLDMLVNESYYQKKVSFLMAFKNEVERKQQNESS